MAEKKETKENVETKKTTARWSASISLILALVFYLLRFYVVGDNALGAMFGFMMLIFLSVGILQIFQNRKTKKKSKK
jgi:hypothetical protein